MTKQPMLSIVLSSILQNHKKLEIILILRKLWRSSKVFRYTKEVTTRAKFSFQHVLPRETYQTITELNTNKTTSRNIPGKTLKKSAKEVCVLLTVCIN